MNFPISNKLFIIMCDIYSFVLYEKFKLMQKQKQKKQNLSQSVLSRNYYCAGNVFVSDIGFFDSTLHLYEFVWFGKQ